MAFNVNVSHSMQMLCVAFNANVSHSIQMYGIQCKCVASNANVWQCVKFDCVDECGHCSQSDTLLRVGMSLSDMWRPLEDDKLEVVASVSSIWASLNWNTYIGIFTRPPINLYGV